MGSMKKVKVIANVSVDTKELLDNVSEKTGIKKGFIIEEGIKAQCEKIISSFVEKE